MHVSVKGVYTNTSTTATYRGAGRPEASYIIERIMVQVKSFKAIDDALHAEIVAKRADEAQRRVNTLRGSLLPSDVDVTVTRDYGETANDKADRKSTRLNSSHT